MTLRPPPVLVRLVLPAWLALVASGLVVARADDPPAPVKATNPPITEDEAEAVADAIAEAVADGDAAALDRQIAWPALYRRASAGVDAPEEFRRNFFTGCEQARLKGQGFSVTLVGVAAKDSTYQLLRTHTKHERQWLLFRLIGADSRVNYHDYLLGRQADGSVRVEDIYIFMQGETLSQTLGRAFRLGVAQASQGGSLLGRLFGAAPKPSPYFDNLKALSEARREGDQRRVVDLAKSFDPEVRQDKTILMIRLGAAQQLGNEDYQATLEEFRQSHPDDACIDMISIDYYLLQKRYADALACIDRVARAIGGDPFLETVRGNVYLESGDIPAAKAVAAKAVADEPTMADGYWSLISVALREKNHGEVLKNLRILRDQLDQNFADLTTANGYEDFVRSSEFQEWLKETAPPPKPDAEAAKPTEAPKGQEAPKG